MYLLKLCLICCLYVVSGCDILDEEDKQVSDVFSKKVTVFKIPIYATSNVSDTTIMHAAKVMAKYLDSNDDGTVNDANVLAALQSSGSGLCITKDGDESESVMDSLGKNGRSLQELYESETVIPNGTNGQFDFALEEILHLITQKGYANVHQELAEVKGSQLANAMDAARGGYFESVPAKYPDGAWYTYDDTTCNYACMITEYFYWGITSFLGAQNFSGRLEQIQHEWKLNTAIKVQNDDTALHTILTNASFNLPSVLPDGNYNSLTFEITAP